MFPSTSTALTVLAALSAAVAPVLGHMEMINPAPWRSKSNPNTVQADIDYSMTSPLDASGANYPCKGYHSVLGTDAGKSVATWAPGSTQTVTIQGSATHGGGSCQLLLSYDGGHSFKVIQSVLGECPEIRDWQFQVPHDAPGGDAVFAWTWFNRLGNREMYMNCASVTIGGGGKRRRDEEEVSYSNSTRRDVSWASAPDLFKANIGNGCGTEEGGDVDFPNPGSNVLRRGGFSPRAPTGNCGGGGGSGSQQPPAPKPDESSAAPSPSSNAGEWAQPSSASAETSSSATFDDGQWRPDSTSAAPTPSISVPDIDNWHNNGTSSTETPAPEPTPSKSKCNRKRRIRRHKKRMNHGQVGTF